MASDDLRRGLTFALSLTLARTFSTLVRPSAPSQRPDSEQSVSQSEKKTVRHNGGTGGKLVNQPI